MKNYFSGWYFKCQSDQTTIAFIVAFHQSKRKNNCSIQIITDENTWNINFPIQAYYQSTKPFYIKIGNNVFTDHEMIINLDSSTLSLAGTMTFTQLFPLKYNIMGPFQYIPFMQCKHSILSMKHYINGTLYINNKKYTFQNDLGYIEGDRGYSFPKQYIWTQCFFENHSLMLSVADIPFGPFHFTGIIGVIIFNNKEYRFATYLNAKVIKKEKNEIVIHQKDMIFKAKLIKRKEMPLLAPSNGEMTRTIHESLTCQASYSLIKGRDILFSFETSHASFEYEYD